MQMDRMEKKRGEETSKVPPAGAQDGAKLLAHKGSKIFHQNKRYWTAVRRPLLGVWDMDDG